MRVNEMCGKGLGFSEYTRFDRALHMILSRVNETDSEKISFDEASERVLSEDVDSNFDVPPFDRSAMDGFAVRAEDTFGADETEPKKLRVIGSIEIGTSSDIEVEEGEAVEIATGAPMPKGADATVMVEKTERRNDVLKVFEPVSPGRNLSPRGEDVEAGQTILKAGRKIRPSDIGMLCSTGNLEVKVRRRPKVGLAITGDELREPGEPLEKGEITESNSRTLGPAIERYGGISHRIGIVPDRIERIRAVFDSADQFDSLVLTGGSSVGEKDLVPDVISDLGELLFHGVAIRPGSPSSFGVVDDTPVFSLAGFPAASLIAFEMLVRPALRKMQGLKPRDFRICVEAELIRKINSKLGRRDVVRVKLEREGGRYSAEPVRVTGSSVLRSVTESNGIVVVPDNSEGFSRGSKINVFPLKL